MGISTFQSASKGKVKSVSFVKWIRNEVEAGNSTVGLEEGELHASSISDGAHITFKDLKGVNVWMDGVNMIMSKAGMTAFKIVNCTDPHTYGPAMW